jgi:hypothetical protein
MPGNGVVRYESVTVAGTAIGITVTPARSILPHAALVTVEDAAIRYRVDGTAPTATEGHIAYPGDVITLSARDEMVGFQAIRKDASSAVIKVTDFVEWVP